MYIDYKPWEYVSIVNAGGYSLVKADEKTRKKQLKEYKNSAVKGLEEKIREIKSLS